MKPRKTISEIIKLAATIEQCADAIFNFLEGEPLGVADLEEPCGLALSVLRSTALVLIKETGEIMAPEESKKAPKEKPKTAPKATPKTAPKAKPEAAAKSKSKPKEEAKVMGFKTFQQYFVDAAEATGDIEECLKYVTVRGYARLSEVPEGERAEIIKDLTEGGA